MAVMLVKFTGQTAPLILSNFYFFIMSLTYTITEVTKEFLKVKYQDGQEITLGIKTWLSKSLIEAQIRRAYNEIDEGSVEDIPFKVGDTGTLKTIQESEKEAVKAQQSRTNDGKTVPAIAMRDVSYPSLRVVADTLIKAILNDDKTDLEKLKAKYDEIDAKYPVENDEKFSSFEFNQARMSNTRSLD